MEWQLEAISSVFLETEYSDESIDTNSDALRDIREAAVDLAARRNEEEWDGRLLRLMNTSHARMNGAKSPIELNTLRKIYTDSCLLRGLSRSLSSHSTEAIAILDSAIIIAGPYGGGRHELLLDAIFKIQQPISTSTTIDIGPEPLGTLATYVQCTIPCLPTPPPFITFQNTFSYGPFILRNYAVHWPALQARPWRSCAYLRSVAGPGRIVPVEVGSDYRTHGWQQKIMPWDEFLALLDFQDQPASNVDPNVYYLAQHDLTRQFPGLRDDVIVPDYVYVQLKTPDFPSYHPPCNEDQILFNTWLGPKGTISPAHVDPYFNLYVQVVGHKSVWLAPPSASAAMYPFMSQPSCSTERKHLPGSALGNTSQVDVFAHPHDLRDYPDFLDKALPSAMMATLGPGDALFFPPGWWHAMRSESTSFSFSMWF